MDDTEITASGLGFLSMNDAPCHLSAPEAEAWASGWNAAIEATLVVERASVSRADPALRRVSEFLDRVEQVAERKR